MNMGRSRLEEALDTLGQVLEARGLRFEVVAVGGSGLLLLGLGTRPTKALDLVATVESGRYANPDPLPGDLAEAREDVVRRMDPSREELLAAARWTRTQDPSSSFRQGLVKVLEELGVEKVDAEI